MVTSEPRWTTEQELGCLREDLVCMAGLGNDLAEAAADLFTPTERALDRLAAYAAGLPERERWPLDDLCQELRQAVDRLDAALADWELSAVGVQHLAERHPEAQGE